jgi:hypothetical protein
MRHRLSRFTTDPIRRLLLLAIAALALSACVGRDPGPLNGTWRVSGRERTTMIFRPGEVEMNGTTDQVIYEHTGMDVFVTYQSGALKGKTVRFTMTGPSSANSEFGAMTRRAR